MLNGLTLVQKLSGLRQAYRVMAEHPQGRQVLADILKVTGVGRHAFAEGAPDLTAHNLGRQYVGEAIKKRLNLNDDELMALLDENVDDVTERTER